ncbi:SpoIID/LytB domain-containing protein [Paenibacillus spongiae]|uniref:SpoIID/LytB domain-containing protein n=1 Tax=Paenibacillus spongiae TaxID=2909671 RepID=A0ABY5S2J8_9BACL|nr:SpoIID/LytB domain-containing protein [Paenibacillus spongiae]UVI28097.1 SpoIID/LytB domain-containing protein [Paenibacillus spongiae]
MKLVQLNGGSRDRRNRSKPVAFMLLLVSLLMLVSVWTVSPSRGAVPSLETIRVALFIEHARYKLNTASATMTSAGALAIGIRQPSGVKPLLQTKAGETVRFTLDDYKVKITETTEFATALAIVKRLKAAGGAGFLTAVPKNNATVYQVMEGSYRSAAEAKTASERWSKDSGIIGVAGKMNVETMGPLHLESGIYSSQAEADKAASAFRALGVDAFTALKQAGTGGGQYTVLVGAAVDQAGLNDVKAKAASGGTLKAADANASYVIIRDDYSVSESANSPMALYSVPLTGTKLWVSTEAATGIKLAERYNRSYRGQFELSGLSGKLAVVNELPFEQYLYAVVGGEMPASWPAEALKAQAVAARTYALYQGFGFQIAHVVDTTLSQVYGGIGSEKPATIKAVDETRGEVAMYNGKVIEALFSSSAGGASADATEIWGNEVPYLKSVTSQDQASEKGLPYWYRVVLPSGETGYIREDLVEATNDATAAGSKIMRVKGDGVMVRPIPLVQDNVPAVGKVGSSTPVVVLERVIQSNENSWVRGPFTPDTLLASIKKVSPSVQGPIRTLEAGNTGPSGRITELLVNGANVTVKNPDSFRSALGGLPSTKLEIDETARMTIAASGDRISERKDGALTVIGADGKPEQLGAGSIFILNGHGEVRAATKEPTFRFVGSGYGHGVGLSQYGARGLAESGYDYKYILQYYYKDITIVKE